MAVMAIMIGIQASGKSTFCKTCLPNFTRINLDTLHTRNKERIAIEEAFRNKEDIVIDNTNPMVSNREVYIQMAKKEGYQVIGYFMQSCVRDCIKRNETRTGKEKILAKAIAATSNKLELPSYKEGFDELFYVSMDEKQYLMKKWRNEDEL